METPRITVAEAKRHMDTNGTVCFVDCRRDSAWYGSNEKLPDAIRVSPDALDGHLPSLPADTMVVTYCTCPNEHSASTVAEAMRGAGLSQVYAMKGGLEAW